METWRTEPQRYRLDEFQIQKGLYYSLVMTTDFEPDLGASQSENPVSPSILEDEGASADLPARHVLSPADTERCRKLMAGIVEYFIPIVFTPVRPIFSSQSF
jgi:hypothetical protein